MAHGPLVPFLSYDQLREKAIGFLSAYHALGTIPVPIEDIVDVQFKIDIIPTPGLLKHYDVDAFITSNMESIYVDEFIYHSRPSRYRFSLAHEIAHAALHQEIFRALSFDSIKAWKVVQQKLSDDQHGWLEFQAMAFAGYVLVPPAPLRAAWHGARTHAENHGVSLADASDAARQIVAGALAVQFDVSREVM